MEKLISLADAAEILGYTTLGLRAIIARSRRKAAGSRVSGPTIRFFEPGKRGAIKFRAEWLEDFINENTCDPSQAVPTTPAAPLRKRLPAKPALDEAADRHGLRVLERLRGS